MSAIEVKGLKKYFGKLRAVDGISFSVEKGEVFGFLGPNGAGKTTTIRTLLDFIRPTAGNIKILGLDAQKDSVEIKKKVSYLSGDVRLYDSWTGNDHINFVRAIRGESDGAEELIQKLDFNPRMPVHHLSSGNKQKLGLILALMSNPELVILDEPTMGLDPLLQNTIYEALGELQQKGTTVFMSSHNLAEVERICSRVAIIKQGKLVATESIQELKKKKIYTICAYFTEKFDPEVFAGDGVTITKELSGGLVLNIKGDINPVLQKLAKHKLKDLEVTHASLEEIFLEYYKKD